MKKSFLLLVAMLFPFSVSANNEVEGALGFMLGGDGGWSAITQDYKVDGCKGYYVQKVATVKLTVNFDFDKANYNSVKYEYKNNRTFFNLSGDKGLQNISALDENGKDGSAIATLSFGIPTGPTKTMAFPLLVTKDRFRKALADLKRNCPGKKSKY